LQREIERYLADSSVWIRYLRRGCPPRLKARIEELLILRLMLLPEIVRLEVLSGVRSDREWEQTEESLGAAIPLRTRAADWNAAGRLGSQLVRIGLIADAGDLLIAAAAINNDVRLLHADRDFERIAEHTALRTAPAFDLLV
jgi:predicted nucleic acid-binding protein